MRQRKSPLNLEESVDGMFVVNNNGITSPQYMLTLAKDQLFIVKVDKYKMYKNMKQRHSTRIAILHQSFSSRSRRALNFTTDFVDDTEFMCTQEMKMGFVFLVPIISGACCEPNLIYFPYVPLVNRINQKHIVLSQGAKTAANLLFSMLDMDVSGWVTRQELNFFKKLLGYSGDITDDEWSNIIMGWTENCYTPSEIQISPEWFLKLLMRITSREEIFDSESPLDQIRMKPYSPSKSGVLQEGLEFVFKSCGFDQNLTPINCYGYAICVSVNRPGLSHVSIISDDVIDVENTLRGTTCLLGRKLTNHCLSISLYAFKCDEWFSLAVKNFSETVLKIELDFTDSLNLLPAMCSCHQADLGNRQEVAPDERKLLTRFRARPQFSVNCNVRVTDSLGNVLFDDHVDFAS